MTDPTRSERAVVVLTTVRDEEEGRRIAHDLLQKRLAACVTLLPGIRSLYRWKGSVEEEPEVGLWIKTLADRIDPLRERLLALHPYELPELLVFDASGGSQEYLAWIREETGTATEGER